MEDHTTTNKVLTDYLRSSGHELLSCFSFEEAFWAGCRYQLDLALCDLNLPDGLGWDLAVPLKANRPAPILIAMTAWPEHETRGRCMAAGFDHFLAKPFLPQELEAILEAASRHEAKEGESLLRLPEFVHQCPEFERRLSKS